MNALIQQRYIEVTVKAFIMVQKSISNKCLFFTKGTMVSFKILSSTTVFNIDKKCLQYFLSTK